MRLGILSALIITFSLPVFANVNVEQQRLAYENDFYNSERARKDDIFIAIGKVLAANNISKEDIQTGTMNLTATEFGEFGFSVIVVLKDGTAFKVHAEENAFELFREKAKFSKGLISGDHTSWTKYSHSQLKSLTKSVDMQSLRGIIKVGNMWTVAQF